MPFLSPFEAKCAAFGQRKQDLQAQIEEWRESGGGSSSLASNPDSSSFKTRIPAASRSELVDTLTRSCSLDVSYILTDIFIFQALVASGAFYFSILASTRGKKKKLGRGAL